jgi:drug/metabolite transporter (DMT)-like permease
VSFLHSKHFIACLWLLTATGLWGLSFPLIKAILQKQELLVPGASSMFLSALGVTVRFAIAGIVLALISIRTLGQITRAEIRQGAGLAFFGGVGILLQMDGLAYTKASTSAFLTQFYCLLLPIWVACRKREWPSAGIFLGSILVLTGVAVLSDVEWPFRIGRGEAETLLASAFFTGQILLLEKPEFAQNRTQNFSVVMLLGTALLIAPVAVISAPSLQTCVRAYADVSVQVMVGVLIVVCTLVAYLLMNGWQKHVTATQAGLIYCFEPLAASLFAVFLPAWLSGFASINYANEQVTPRLLIGGALILGANVLIQLEATRKHLDVAMTNPS